MTVLFTGMWPSWKRWFKVKNRWSDAWKTQEIKTPLVNIDP